MNLYRYRYEHWIHHWCFLCTVVLSPEIHMPNGFHFASCWSSTLFHHPKHAESIYPFPLRNRGTFRSSSCSFGLLKIKNDVDRQTNTKTNKHSYDPSDVITLSLLQGLPNRRHFGEINKGLRAGSGRRGRRRFHRLRCILQQLFHFSTFIYRSPSIVKKSDYNIATKKYLSPWSFLSQEQEWQRVWAWWVR